MKLVALALLVAGIWSHGVLAEIKALEVKGAPFELTVNEWTPPAREFRISDYGAKPVNGDFAAAEPVTEAMEKTIAAAVKAGGGRVVVPQGEWKCGAFDLKSDIALVLEKGAVLHFPDDPVVVSRLPLRENGRPRLSRGGLINARGCTNVAVMGAGTVKSDVDYWHRNFLMNPVKGFPRPQVFTFRNCRNVRFEGFRIRGTPAWTMHFLLCEDIILRGVDSVCAGPNSDGVDFESCRRVLVEHCSLDQTDDTYTIKSGMNEVGRRRNVPTENVVIRHCRGQGHTLLAIGSEISGGIRNIYMTDCEVTGYAWNWLFIKTNEKRGAYVENIWMENIRGLRANNVMNVEMFYDGNPNKELTKRGSKQFVSAIRGIHAKNIDCAAAKHAVKVTGDAYLPPKALTAENIRVGHVTGQLVKTNGVGELSVRNVVEDPAVAREVRNLASSQKVLGVEACETARAGETLAGTKVLAGEKIMREDLEALSLNAAFRRVLKSRIDAECAANRAVAPVIEPWSPLAMPENWEANYRNRLDAILATTGAALPEAIVADDVQAVAREALNGVKLTLALDQAAGEATVKLFNGSAVPLTELHGTVHLPPKYMNSIRSFRVPAVKPGETLTRTFDLGVVSPYLPVPVGEALYAAEADFSADAKRTRLWTSGSFKEAPRYGGLLPNETAKWSGVVDVSDLDEAALLKASGESGALPALGFNGDKAWRSTFNEEAAWFVLSGLDRPYTAAEAALVRAGRAREALALDFMVPTNAVTIMRCVAYLWARKDMKAYLNGEAIKVGGKSFNLPTRVGRNRLIVSYPAKSGKVKPSVKLAVYPWSATDPFECLPIPEAAPKAADTAAGPVKFPLDWNPRSATAEPLEVEISRGKLSRAFGSGKDTGFAVSALTDKGEVTVPVTLLPGRAPDAVRLRFTPPVGAKALFCAAAGKGELAKPGKVDNFFAGALAEPKRWQCSPRMKITPGADGALEFSARSVGSPEATLAAAVPAEARGKGVRFEFNCENLIDGAYGFSAVIKQYDEAGKMLPESVTDRRWTMLQMAPLKTCRFSERGRLHTRAAKVELKLAIHSPRTDLDLYGLPMDPAKAPLQRLKVSLVALRLARDLPFPGYDDSNFAPGVSGEAGDFALVSGGEFQKGFAYQTRSLASWSDAKQLRKEEQLFFPAGAGTVEAYFKSDWKANKYRDGKGKERSRAVVLFQSYQGYRARECKGGKGAMLQLGYRPLEQRMEFTICDYLGKRYTDEWAQVLPKAAWTHLAVQWAPGDKAEIFVDGRKVRTLAIPEWRALDLADENIKVPNDENGLEFYAGANNQSLRVDSIQNPEYPLFDGAIDLLRVSTGRRYAVDFTPAKKFALDGDTRALFDFDRVFDGFSGAGAGWIPATTYSQGCGRVQRDVVTVTGAKGRYYPREILPENDPRVVFDILNFPTLPTAEDFRTARKPFTHTKTVKAGDKFTLDCPAGTVADFVEIENLGENTLLCPVAVKDGDIDARSYGDLADSLKMSELTNDRDRVNRVFQFVLSTSDYFMFHSPMFRPGSDKPSDVEYRSLFMLNSYCGFECGPLNHMTANLFVNVARCPASLTAGFGHEFEQVHFDGKTHIYDLSMKKFFPAMDNETSAYLEEAGDEAGIFARMGNAAEHFIRKSTRSHWLGSPENYPKIGVALRPRERIRVWNVNDGNLVDLITRSKTGVYSFKPSKWRPDYTEICHADTSKMLCDRVERVFPQYSNGFIYFDGVPSQSHPAFTNATADSFTFVVDSRSYPVVRGDYAAHLKNGAKAELELSTDFGKTFRPLACPATYPLRARYVYWVRVKAPMSEVTRFTAETELQLNTRVYPGWLKPGRNEYTFKCVGEGKAKVTLGGREPARKLDIPAAAASGTIIGNEKRFYAYDPAFPTALDVKGASDKATVRVMGDITAKLENGKLTLGGKPGRARFGTVTIVDEGAELTLTVLCGTDVRFATAANAKYVEGARQVPASSTCPHVLACLPGNNRQAEVQFQFAPLKAGKYAVLNLNRFASHPHRDREDGLRMLWPGKKSVACGSERNLGCNYKRTNYGQAGGRANLKWDYPWHPGTWYPYPLIAVTEQPAASYISFRSWRSDMVEVGAVLVVPNPDIELRCELLRHLASLNHDAARIHACGKAQACNRAENMQ